MLKAQDHFFIPSASSEPPRSIQLGLLGLEPAGKQVYQQLHANPEIEFQGLSIPTHQQPEGSSLHPPLLVKNLAELVRDESLHAVVESLPADTTRNLDLARDWVMEALLQKKHVITGNSALMARYGAELIDLAKTHHVCLHYEGTVGLPFLSPLQQLAAEGPVLECLAVFSPTASLILHLMESQGVDYAQAFQPFAEPFLNDKIGYRKLKGELEGIEAANQLAVLASILYRKRIEAQHIYTKGISGLNYVDLRHTKALGFNTQFLGMIRQADAGYLDLRVHPTLMPEDHTLAKLPRNAVSLWVKPQNGGEFVFSSQDATPTAAMMARNLLTLVSQLKQGLQPITPSEPEIKGFANILPITETQNRYYLRISSPSGSQLLNNIGRVFGQHHIECQQTQQLSAQEKPTLLLVTNKISEEQLRKALDSLIQSDTQLQIHCVLRAL